MTISSSDSLIEKIKSRGHWKIRIRPTTYVENRFGIDECEEKVLHAKVRKRGWDYPHVGSQNEIVNYMHYVEKTVDWRVHTELWRMYRSGQFLHLLSMWEDGNEGLRIFSPASMIIPKGYGLEFTMTLYTIYEIYEFASRLCREGYDDGIEINIELHGMKNRRIVTADFGRHIFEHICQVNVIPLKRTFRYSELISKKKEFVLDHVKEIFMAFNWKDPNMRAVEEEYDKYEKGVM